VEYAWSRGAVPVVAAGNSSLTPSYGTLHMIVVAATTPTGDVATYSNHVDNARWGVAAPGGASDGNPYDDIISTFPGSHYATIAGSSMAAAHVSGAVALLRAKGYGPDEAVQRLRDSAVPCAGCGSGRIDIAAAVGAGPAPAPVLPPGGGGTGSAAPGSATVVAPKAHTASGSGAPPRAAAPRTTTTPQTAAVTAPSTSLPPTSLPPGPLEAALGSPWPGQVQVNSAPAGGRGSSNRLLPIGLALTGLIGVGAALGFRAWHGPLRGT
jgi:subtilisin family serine protease